MYIYMYICIHKYTKIHENAYFLIQVDIFCCKL